MRRYPFLRFAGGVLRVVGWVVLVLGVIASILGGILLGMTANGFVAILMGGVVMLMGMIASFLAWLFLLAAREIFYLLVDVEENTRTTAERGAQQGTL